MFCSIFEGIFKTESVFEFKSIAGKYVENHGR